MDIDWLWKQNKESVKCTFNPALYISVKSALLEILQVMALLLSSVLTKKKVIDEYYMDDTMAVKWGGLL